MRLEAGGIEHAAVCLASGEDLKLATFAIFAAGLGLGLALLWSKTRIWTFHAQSPTDYTAEVPAFDVRSELSGPIRCQGVIFDYKGQASSRFTADMNGRWTNDGGTLSENFVYHSGRKQDRCWTIKMGEGGAFTATAPDVVGEGHGIQSGPTVRLTYRIKLPEDVGSHVLDVVDWMYLAGDGVILNRSEFRKYGIKVAELFATMKKVA